MGGLFLFLTGISFVSLMAYHCYRCYKEYLEDYDISTPSWDIRDAYMDEKDIEE